MIFHNRPCLTIVVPCFNEEKVLPETINRLSKLLTKYIRTNVVSTESTILFVDDGSKDSTWSIIETHNKSNSLISGIKLSKNSGHQNALLAGLMHAKDYSDCVLSIDADLQDDLEVIAEFIEKYKGGSDIVYGVRNKRDKDTLFKRTTAQGFYRLMQIMGVNIVYNHADFRLMSNRALEHLSNFQEVNLFLRGLIPLIGFKSTVVHYERHERFAGESKYPLKKMVAFAFDGITSFSVTPIRLISSIGFFMFLCSLLMFVYVIYERIFGYTVSGWSSLMVSIWFIGSLQLIALGLIGEYIGKIYKEVKKRPRYIIEESLRKKHNEHHDYVGEIPMETFIKQH